MGREVGPQTLCPQSGLELLINRMVIAFLPLRLWRLFHFVNYHTYLRREASLELFGEFSMDGLINKRCGKFKDTIHICLSGYAKAI